MVPVTAIATLRNTLQPFRQDKKKIGFVPTMGYLHEGHLSLIRQAKKECDCVVVSIFVNPTQFAPNEDYTRYPRDIERDSKLARSAGCDILFIPESEEIYPDGFASVVYTENFSSLLEGKFRPSHFKGVTTIVNILFNIVQPNVTYFGQKDIQQCIVIKKMVKDLNIPLQIIILPTVREPNGLALSSRNMYLSQDEHDRSAILFQSLKFAEEKIKNGERNTRDIIQEMTRLIQSKKPTQIDYIEIVDHDTLQRKEILEKGDAVIIPIAVRFGTTRLIDNIIISV